MLNWWEAIWLALFGLWLYAWVTLVTMVVFIKWWWPWMW